MTFNISIRSAREQDLPAITSIYGHYVFNHTASFETEPPSLAEMTHRWLKMTEKGLPYVIAEAEGRVVGYAYASAYRPRPAYRFTVEDSVYVHPDFAGRGLGRRLLSQVIDACEKSGYRQMIAIIGDSGNAASIALHAALGFRQAGVLQSVGFKFGRWLDTVMMQRQLGRGDEVQP